MPTPFQMTASQVRSYQTRMQAHAQVEDVSKQKSKKPRVQRPSTEKLVQLRTNHLEELIKQVQSLCMVHGWKIGLCRVPSDNPQNANYPSISDREATPNCVIAWRECAQYALPRTMHVMWLWELEEAIA